MSDLPTGVAYYTVTELAAHLRVSTMTVHRAIEHGGLPALRIGSPGRPRVRIPVTDAHQWILNHLNTQESDR